jgi:hypothetical protein
MVRPFEEGEAYYSSEQNRAYDTRRDNDTVKVPKVGLYDVDYSVFYHLTENVKLFVLDNDNRVPVPVMFANGEKWSQIRQFGYLRDNNRKVMAPLITLLRTDTQPDDRFALLTDQLGQWNDASTLRYVPKKTSSMQYDRVAGQYLTKYSTEIHLVSVPDYVRVNYQMTVWTDLQEQMNNIVQMLIPLNGHLWGDYYSFRTTYTSGFTHETVNVPGEDRLVKTTISLQVDAYLRNEFDYQISNVTKAFSIKRVDFLNESTEEIFY